MNVYRIYCVALVWFMFCTSEHAPLIAQTNKITFENLTTAQGLPQISVSCILQDRFGYIWFGTQDGLARFDGHSFMVLRHNPLDSLSLSNNAIRALLEDHNGDLWVGTAGGGVNRMNRSTGKITRYEHNPTDPNSLSHYEIWALLEDREGTVWIGTSGGLNRFNRSTGKFTRYQAEERNPESLSDNVILSIVEEQKRVRYGNKLWLGTGKGLNSFDRTTGKCTRYLHNPANPESISSNNFVKTVLESHDGMLWVSTLEGFNRFDRASGKFTRYQHHPANPAGLRTNRIITLMEERGQQGVLWVGTEEGLHIFDRTSGKFTRYNHSDADPTTICHDKILTFFQDRSGIIWIGTGNGVSRFDPTVDKFIRYQHNTFDAGSLSNNNVWSILEDHSGGLWIGTSGGLHYFDRSKGKFICYKNKPGNPHSLGDNEVWSLLEDRSGNIWAGTRNGLNCLNRTTGRFTRYIHNPADPKSLSNSGIFTLFEDRAGRIWAGTGRGVNRFEPGSATFIRYLHNPADSTSLTGNVITSFWETQTNAHGDGTLWIGARGGLNRFNHKTGFFKQYKHKTGDTSGLNNNLVATIYEDRSGILWIGTYGGGLNRFDPNSGTFTAFREKDGLPNDTVYGIVEDEQGNLWFSTNKGLCRFNPQNHAVKVYDKRDGLQDNEFSSGAFFRGRSGRMYFGGTNGFNEFFPDKIRANLTPPPVLLTMFKKFNRPFDLDSALEIKKLITLPHDENDIGFEFVTVSFSISERNLYRYKLEGYDKNWSPAGTERKATYTNLDPGDYTFRVLGCNSDGVWNFEGASVRIIILPPWWARWWARTAGILCFVGLLFQAYRWRVRALARHNARLERQVQERTTQLHEANLEITRQMEVLTEQATEIQNVNTTLINMNARLGATNDALTKLSNEKDEFMGIAAHDLRNPIGSIRSLATLLEEAQHLAPEKIQNIGAMVRKSSDMMLTLIGNLLNINALERDAAQYLPEYFDVLFLLHDIVGDYEARATAKAIKIHNTVLASETLIYADRTACLQIFDNIISNAVKYSPHGRQIWITLDHGSETRQTKEGQSQIVVPSLHVSVRDEGRGFTEDDKQRLFGKFARLSTEPTGGEQRTGLGLSIVKRLVEAQQGRVWCESELGKGATFIVELPTTNRDDGEKR